MPATKNHAVLRRLLAPAILATAAVTVAATIASTGLASDKAPADNTAAAAPLSGITIPDGYRDWKLISVAREEGKQDDIRAILGNDIALKAYREKTLPFPDGAIIARLAWSYDVSEENNEAFGRVQSHVAGAPKNGVQFMVKDTQRYAATGGWGYAQFNDGKPAAESVHQTCFACHQPAAARDYVFTRYAP